MVFFDEEKQKQRLSFLKAQEEEELAKLLSQRYGILYYDLTNVPINTDALRIIPEDVARKYELAAFNVIGKKLDIATRSPRKDEVTAYLNDLETRGYTITLYMVSKKSLEFAWNHYEDISRATKTKSGSIDISGTEIEQFLNEAKTTSSVSSFIQQTFSSKQSTRVSRIVEALLAGAIASKASDIHIEPEEGSVRLRFRLDGLLTDIIDFDYDTYHLLSSRVKLLSGLKLNIKDEAQDGRFSISIGDTEIEVRASSIPGEYGESIVLRILNPDAIRTKMEDLGMHPVLLEIMKKEIAKPNGIIINTGPTGSGKTTTLYSFLSFVHNPDIKIITIEDPIEYHINGIVQTQVDRAKKYTFAKGLRAALRQDPDVLMVGEIRDKQTAEIAINSSLTGHLVFSTLHTNNAGGTFPRLIDMGINPNIIEDALNVVMAQRLVRRLCESCKEKRTPTEEEKNEIDTVLGSIKDDGYKKGVQTEITWHAHEEGCEKCGGSGYKGRIGVFEAILVDDEVGAVVRKSPSEKEIWEVAEKQNIINMKQDGILKVLNGVTTMDEVRRVLG